MTFIIPLIVIAAIGGYFFYMKKSGKFDQLSNNFVEAEKDAKENFETYFEKFKADENTFKPIKDIIGGDFTAIAACKEPQSMAGAAADTAKTLLTGVVVENLNKHLLVLQEDKLHFIEYNRQSHKAAQHWEFDKSNITDLVLKKGELKDNLKQSMSFDLKNGGKSGDKVDNSELHKLTFKSKDKSYEFFVYDKVGFGEAFQVENRIGGMGLNQSVDEMVRSVYMPQMLADLFFTKIKSFKPNSLA